MMHVLWGELTVSSIAFNVKSSIWDVVPSGLRFISEHDVGAVVPLEESPHSLGEHPCALVIWTLVEPMVEWALETVCPSCDVSWEFPLESWNNVVEWKGVGAQVNPSRVGSKNGQSVSWPETVMLVPAGNVWLSFVHVSDEILNVEFKSSESIFLLNVLLENSGPLFAGNIIGDMLIGFGNITFIINNLLGDMDVALKFLVRLIKSMVKWTSLKVNHSSASLHVVDSGSESNLGSEAVTSKSGHGKLLLIHKSDDVCRDILHGKALVVIGITHVSVVEKPHISNVQNLALLHFKELLEVFRWLDKVTEPNHGWEIWFFALQKGTSELHRIGITFQLGLYLLNQIKKNHLLELIILNWFDKMLCLLDYNTLESMFILLLININ